METTKFKEYMAFIDDLTNEAGKVMKEGFYGEKEIEFKAGPWDLVTDYDKKVENIILTKIKETYPTHKVIAEEDSAAKKNVEPLTDNPTWLIDPIDGTQNFARMMPDTCISAALAINKQVVVAIIYNPISDQKYTAIKGQGAFLNGKPIQVSKAKELDGAVVSFEYLFVRVPKFEKINQRFEAIIKQAYGYRNYGSAAITLSLVACGGLDVYFVQMLNSWDMAAGVLIIQEAGGCICDVEGGEFTLESRSLLAAANKSIADEVLQIFKKHPL